MKMTNPVRESFPFSHENVIASHLNSLEIDPEHVCMSKKVIAAPYVSKIQSKQNQEPQNLDSIRLLHASLLQCYLHKLNEELVLAKLGSKRAIVFF